MTNPVERRLSPRFRAAQLPGVVAVRVKPGIKVTVVDVSAAGLRIETPTRLLPGSYVHVVLVASAGQIIRTRGHVIRCHVSALWAGEIRYHGAVRFEHEQAWVIPEDSIGPAREVYSHIATPPSGYSA